MANRLAVRALRIEGLPEARRVASAATQETLPGPFRSLARSEAVTPREALAVEADILVAATTEAAVATSAVVVIRVVDTRAAATVVAAAIAASATTECYDCGLSIPIRSSAANVDCAEVWWMKMPPASSQRKRYFR